MHKPKTLIKPCSPESRPAVVCATYLLDGTTILRYPPKPATDNSHFLSVILPLHSAYRRDQKAQRRPRRMQRAKCQRNYTTSRNNASRFRKNQSILHLQYQNPDQNTFLAGSFASNPNHTTSNLNFAGHQTRQQQASTNSLWEKSWQDAPGMKSSTAMAATAKEFRPGVSQRIGESTELATESQQKLRTRAMDPEPTRTPRRPAASAPECPFPRVPARQETLIMSSLKQVKP